MEGSLKTVGVLTSGGDAPGMNACIRAVVRSALNRGCRVMGIRKGYAGLLKGDVMEMNATSVANIIHRGGTILYTARCPEFLEVEYQDRAAEMCRIFGIDGLVVIGGDGSFRGAQKLSQRGISVVGVPGTIDLDIVCSDYTIGFDTAVNVVVEAVSRLRDTSASHERCSVVEVMGRNCGEIALWSGIATGADAIMIPEDAESQSFDHLVRVIMENRARGKNHNIIIVAEGVKDYPAIIDELNTQLGADIRTTVIGHIQRGGSPSMADRILASKFGARAVELLAEGKGGRVVGIVDNHIIDRDIIEAVNMKRPVDMYMYQLAKILAM